MTRDRNGKSEISVHQRRRRKAHRRYGRGGSGRRQCVVRAESCPNICPGSRAAEQADQPRPDRFRGGAPNSPQGWRSALGAAAFSPGETAGRHDRRERRLHGHHRKRRRPGKAAPERSDVARDRRQPARQRHLLLCARHGRKPEISLYQRRRRKAHRRHSRGSAGRLWSSARADPAGIPADTGGCGSSRHARSDRCDGGGPHSPQGWRSCVGCACVLARRDRRTA